MANNPLPSMSRYRMPQPPPRLPYQAPLGTLTVMALAFGLGVFGAYMLDLHNHRCSSCGNKWWHLGAFNLGDPASHTCKQCGTVQWFKDGAPHVFRNVLSSPPPPAPVPSVVGITPSYGVPRPQLAIGASLQDQGVLR
jgi:hypothetical protein